MLCMYVRDTYRKYIIIRTNIYFPSPEHCRSCHIIDSELPFQPLVEKGNVRERREAVCL